MHTPCKIPAKGLNSILDVVVFTDIQKEEA